MATPTSSLTFLHPCLTPINGLPTNSALCLLTKEIYANVCAIPSTHGGGTHGHLGLVMTTVDYQTISAITFLLPAHPGDAPVVPAGADQLVANKIVRVFKAELAKLTLAATLRKELKKILTAVDRLYLAALDDDIFGFADTTVTNMLLHLHTTYGLITQSELESNWASIATLWTPNKPIKSLWEWLCKV